MPALHLSALIFFQDAAASAQDVHWLTIFVGIIAAFCLVVLLGIIVALVLVMGLAKKVQKIASDTQAKAQPLIAKGQEIMGHTNEILADLKPKIARVSADLQPKIASISSDVQHISGVVRAKTDEAAQTFARVNDTVQEYSETAKEVNSKAKAQVQRVNGMVSDALTTTEQVSKQIQHGIRVPVEKIASWVTAARMGIENLGETLGSKIPFLQDLGPKGRGASGHRTSSSYPTAERAADVADRYGAAKVTPIAGPGTAGAGAAGAESGVGSGPTGPYARKTPPVG